MISLHVLAAIIFLVSGVLSLVTDQSKIWSLTIASGVGTIASGLLLLVLTPASIAATCGRAAVIVTVVIGLRVALKKREAINA